MHRALNRAGVGAQERAAFLFLLDRPHRNCSASVVVGLVVVGGELDFVSLGAFSPCASGKARRHTMGCVERQNLLRLFCGPRAIWHWQISF